jgi:hypothetical protein
VSTYWRVSLARADGGDLYLFHDSSRTGAEKTVQALRDETGCDRFRAEADDGEPHAERVNRP